MNSERCFRGRRNNITNVILDVGVILGFLMGSSDNAMKLADHIENKDCELQLIYCYPNFLELERVCNRFSYGPQMIHYHYIQRFRKIKKLSWENPVNNLDPNCIPSHKNDRHLFECAEGANCKYLITKDGRLKVSDNCTLKIVQLDEFLNNYHDCSTSN